MNNPWQLYDDLIKGIPEGPTVKYYQGGHKWSRVISSENSIGLALDICLTTRPCLSQDVNLIGKPICEVAKLVKSWNFVEASIGLAAINSWYNQPKRVEQCGFVHPNFNYNFQKAFDVYYEEVKGKKVTVVGHFPFIEKRFEGQCDLSILERNPSMGDYPDSACEYILHEQDYVFITGSALVNKTMPRLLELSNNAKVVIVGPSTPLAPILFEKGIYGLSGFASDNVEEVESALSGGTNASFFDAGMLIDQINPHKR